MYPVILQIGPFTLSSLWLFSVMGVIVGVQVALLMIKKRKLKLNIFFEYPLIFIIVPLIAGRLIGVLLNLFNRFESQTSLTVLQIFKFWDQKFSLWGALVAFIIIMIVILHKKKEPFLPWLDVLSIPVLVGLTFINIGKYLDGSGYGRPTNLPWGVTFENIDVTYTVPIHPTQIYQFIYTVLIIILSIYISKKYHFLDKDGYLGLYPMFIYFICRFIEEFFRGDNTLMIGPVRLNQIITIMIIGTIGFVIFTKSKREFNL